MKIALPLDNNKLAVLNQCMSALDSLNFANQPRAVKSAISICLELRNELLQKAIKTRQKTSSFAFKLSYYKADALWNYLHHFQIYFPEDFGVYENNVVRTIKNELHQKLQ